MKYRAYAVAVVFFATILVAFACEEDASVVLVNNTASPITVYLDDQPTVPSTAIPPGGTVSAGAIIDEWPSTVTARDATGHVIFSHRYTWDEINKAGGRIIIGCDSTPTATATGTPTAATTPC